MFSLEEKVTSLPYDEDSLRALLRPWPPAWMQPDTADVKLKQSTKIQLGEHIHWSDLLTRLAPGERPEVHVYTDGSWHPRKQVGGYAVVILPAASGMQAIFGLLGEQVQGDPHTLWAFQAPPALLTEQVALITALLWLAQGCTFLQFGAVHVHFDCTSAGWSMSGRWSPANPLAAKAHHLEQYLQELIDPPPIYEYVAAHKGNPYNEFADTLVKAVSERGLMLPRPPEATVRAFLEADLTWLSVMARNTWQKGLPLFAGGLLRWNPDDFQARQISGQTS